MSVRFVDTWNYLHNRLSYISMIRTLSDLFKTISEAFPEDVATEYYLTKAIKYVMDGVGADWSGVEEMVSK